MGAVRGGRGGGSWSDTLLDLVHGGCTGGCHPICHSNGVSTVGLSHCLYAKDIPP